MAEIDVDGVVSCIEAGSYDDGISKFEDYLINPDNSGLYKRGVKMCLGNHEGFPALYRAFLNLEEDSNASTFGREVASSLNASFSPYTTGDLELVYPHFRFHGLKLPKVKDVTQKIENNAAVIDETLPERDRIKSDHGRYTEIDNKYYYFITNGDGDDFEGLSLRLFRKRDDKLIKSDTLFAQVGFYVDFNNRLSYISNCQGRKARREDDEKLKRNPKNRKLGREFAKFKNEYSYEPRTFIIRKLFEILREVQIKSVLAIRPNEHVMKIGNHSSFKANYDSVLEEAGMDVVDDVYRRLNSSSFLSSKYLNNPI